MGFYRGEALQTRPLAILELVSTGGNFEIADHILPGVAELQVRSCLFSLKEPTDTSRVFLRRQVESG